ncbi:DEAD/DEAH box helicase [Halobiforma nitratireducens]|uniref:DEAD/DEAH box helicase domain protein n=1 Tax=Halobiforma nitratireducens JCM 10879 TaxID=1227454 RepID=M0LBQ3_9EURY|nr:DEAD/DEAH box helicase [Halobiforma nitratireducens]EMA29405.1 DEAD/DEAH box helicase domain protein [Halobiforma nitratireducens JCM 10879]
MDEDRPTDDLSLTPDELRDSYPTNRYHGQLRERITLPAQSADYVPPGEVLPAKLASRLPVDLWSHQAAALEALADGENVCVSTSTSSGKTYVYGLEIARRALGRSERTDEVRALLVYPTKALSRDQERELAELFADLGLDLTVGVYDGDTDPSDKARIREEANVVITNVAGLNQYLEGHHRWADVHANCELVVVDEAHSWTGISGMHAAWVLRRARRVIDWYGGDPQYVLTSATIGNPGEHAQALTGEPATVIDDDGSPSGRRHLVFWEPPEDEGSDGDARPSKRPATVEAPELWAHCCYHGVPSLLFCDSRKGTELAVDRATAFVTSAASPYQGSVALEPYNAGHGKRSRRETESRLKAGDLDGVATTSALEVGIDVGGIDGTVLVGYPGSRSSFWQRLGRAGRGTRESLSVFVPDHATLDGYVSQHPEYLLEQDPEDAVVDLENQPVFLQHLRCAAQELPVTREDADRFGGRERLLPARSEMCIRDSIYAAGGRGFDVRVAGDESIDHEPIGEARAFRDYHEGATVLYQGDRYEVRALRDDRPQPFVELEPADVDYYTQSQRQVAIHDTEVRRSREVEDGAGFRLNWGYGTVTVRYPTYTKRDVETGEVLETGLETGVPPVEMRTQLCWAEVPTAIERAVTDAHADYRNEECVDLPPRLHGYLGGIHAIEHAMIGVAPLELTVDSDDLGGLATNRLPDAPETSGWFIYDGVEGGVGFSRRIYEEYEAVARRARELIVDCDCGRDEGCPACLMSDRCGNDNRPLYGPAATDVIDALLGEGEDTSERVVRTVNSSQSQSQSQGSDDAGDETEPERRRPPASVS